MSFMGGITDFLTGGANQQAEDALNKALAQYDQVHVPTEQQLTLPELQQYVQAGMMTPAQAEAVLQKNNAYNNVTTDPKAKEAEMQALSQMQDIAGSGGMDAKEQAALDNTKSQLNTTLQGQRGSIEDQMAARGISGSLMGTAMENAAASQDAEQAHKDALQANADAQTRALQAISGSGQLGGQIEAQNFGEAAQKAQSQNAIDQWNAANQTNVNLANQQAAQQANSFNAQNAQSVSNANTQNSNARTSYNAQLAQLLYNDQMGLANAKAGINTQQANQYTHQGEQNAGTAGAIINLAAPQPFTGQSAGSTAAGPQGGGSGGGAAPAGGASAFSSFGGSGAGAAGGGAGGGAGAGDAALVMAAAHGGEVPGKPVVPGNSPMNDRVPAVLSPGEVVIPRTAAHSPSLAAEFVRHLHKAPAPKQVHPEDVKSVLHALTAMRGGF